MSFDAKKISMMIGAVAGMLMLGSVVLADDAAPLVITIENHAFTPKEIHIPANQKFEFKVVNKDDSVEEFESPGLKVEKVIPAKSEMVIRLKPVAAGNYTFVGEYHEKTARGLAVVK